MKQYVKLGEDDFELEIVRKRNIKHIYLKILEPKKLQIRTNIWLSKEEILAFIEKKSPWILKNHQNISKNILNNDEMLYLGTIFKKDQLLNQKEDIDKFYRNKAIEKITPMVYSFADTMGLYPTQIKFRKNKRRWGSCSYRNNINLNTNLIKHDIKFIEYVVVHELAHIKHKNHKKEFWALVEKYLPDYKERERLYLLSVNDL